MWAAPDLEGYLFPATYKFPIGASETDIAQKMLDDFSKRVVEGKAAFKRSVGHTPLALEERNDLFQDLVECHGDSPVHP